MASITAGKIFSYIIYLCSGWLLLEFVDPDIQKIIQYKDLQELRAAIFERNRIYTVMVFSFLVGLLIIYQNILKIETTRLERKRLKLEIEILKKQKNENVELDAETIGD